jgi:hypothetical protein
MVLEIKGLKIPSSMDEITNLDQRLPEHPDHLRTEGRELGMIYLNNVLVVVYSY